VKQNYLFYPNRWFILMKIYIKNSAKSLKESYAGTFRAMRTNVGTPYDWQESPKDGEDLTYVAKAVMHRNGKILLLKNDQGWDLPGGHIKRNETLTQGLHREVFEETGLQIIDPRDLNFKHNNKNFFKGEFGGGEVMLSDEHQAHELFSLEQVKNLEISSYYREAIMIAMGEDPHEAIKIKVVIKTQG